MLPNDWFQHSTVQLWNDARVNKLVQILGTEWFPGKRILEVGAGHGNCGKALANLGASVVFTDGRNDHVSLLRADDREVYLVDHDRVWGLGQKFDLVVHWGLMYHLNNWKVDVACALLHAPLLCLETEVIDWNDPTYELKRDEIDQYDQALNLVGTVIPASRFEQYVCHLGSTFIRYDDADLNVLENIHYYDWKEQNSGHFQQGQRRFWMVRHNEDLA